VRLLVRAWAAATLALLAACAKTVQVPALPSPPTIVAPPAIAPPVIAPLPPANGRAAGMTVLSPPASLDEGSASRALRAFLISCPALQQRQDKSFLSEVGDWAGVCSAAAQVQSGNAASFFRDRFDWVRIGDGKAFATGYYIPETAGSRSPLAGYNVPVYRTPPDLVRCTRADGTTARGRVDQTGSCVPYYSRAEIEDGALAEKGLEIAWAIDPTDLFFIEIQGSGELRLPDGSVMRIGYDNQNGRDYVAIGRLLRERGILPPGGANMKSIRDWIRANPDQGRELMRENNSYIFFKELTGPPLGALALPIAPRTTVAADPNFIPLGAPVFLTMDRSDADGFWVAQDVGGAIKGANRFDTFWGDGPEASAIAGGMSASGTALLLLPKGVAGRALSQP
jgi:membrane-bound lytic murein transglycosylase A